MGASRKSEQPCGGRCYSTTVDNAPLKVVYCNVAGINVSEIDTFLGLLEFDLQWDFLVLLGFQRRVVNYICQEFVKRDTLFLPCHLNMVGGRAPSSFTNVCRYARSRSLIMAPPLGRISAGEAGE